MDNCAATLLIYRFCIAPKVRGMHFIVSVSVRCRCPWFPRSIKGLVITIGYVDENVFGMFWEISSWFLVMARGNYTLTNSHVITWLVDLRLKL
jgi:hypothetical protein